MKNVVLWGFTFQDVRDIMEHLNNDVIYIKKWIINEDESRDNFFDNYAIEFASGWHNKGFFSVGECPGKEITDFIYDHMELLMQNFARDDFVYRLPRYEYVNIINMLVNHYYNTLKNGIDMVVFEDIPHGGSGLVMYYVAKAMGIQTLLLVPIYDFEHFIYCYSIEDYGIFSDVPDYHEAVAEVRIEKGYRKELSYMTSQAIAKDLGKHSISYYFQMVLSPKNFWQKKRILLKEQKAKYLDVYEFVDKKITKSIGKYFQRKRYEKDSKKTVTKIDFARKYVYFPLHLQPEMTTDVLGGEYSDQLLAIEKLRNMLPDDWFIYVKENPKQKEYMRGRYFFERLSLIPNTVFVDRSVDTYKLMESAQFVATITGTAAWEAITGGKNALLFGRIWFDHFPGIFRYDDQVNLHDILSYRIDHSALEERLNFLKKKMIKGIYRNDLLCLVDDFNRDKNYSALMKFFRYIFSKEGCSHVQ